MDPSEPDILEPFQPGAEDGGALERLITLTLRRGHMPAEDEVHQAVYSDMEYAGASTSPAAFFDEWARASDRLEAALEADRLEDRLLATTPEVSAPSTRTPRI